ncbi:putative glycosylphosphatidylinositol-alpha 1,2 mannosyltransferase [Saccharomycopsis crataegensis]|uniref:Mannosyltransferase n=1 Tax=Saccharomycopsis crataegensis TaxID=43959 RepID=A0AAV5QEX4_9ASCO|nr:putative glycosylphosphatidylinositol-alpha 1,2 mannosyltransferase [Saccharomycopsis crataegensis]
MVDETELKRRRKEKEEQEEVVAKDEQVAVQKIEKQKTQYESLPKPLVIQYLILLRLINAFTVNTFFQPDEYFQSLEPAHQFAFGYGDLTWEWIDQLRSFNYPFMFYLSFKLSDLLGFGDVGVLLMPKIFQGVVSAISEFYLYTFSQKLFGNETLARAVLLLSVVSSFNWFCFTRTFSSTFELNLTIIALNYWPWEFLQGQKKTIDLSQLGKSLTFAALAVIVRPTNIFIWIVLGPYMLFKVSGLGNKLKILGLAMVVGSVIFAINTAIDFYYYERLVFPIVNFVKFNVLNSFADFYGINSWHFHLTQSIPFILTSYLPFFIFGLVCGDFQFKSLFLSVLAVNIGVFSLITHKEFRFIYQLMPFLLVIAAQGFYRFYKFSTSTDQASSSLIFPRWAGKVVIYAILIINLALGVLLTQVQERGVIDVINFLKFNPDVDSIGFLTPCHSTPLQSYLHRPDLNHKIWYLTCEPPSSSMMDPEIFTTESIKTTLANYKDESDKFYDDPKSYLDIHFPPFNKQFRTKGRVYNYEWPTHLVFFEALEPFMKNYLQNSKYEECDRFFNSYFHWDSRRSGDVVVYCKWPWE